MDSGDADTPRHSQNPGGGASLPPGNVDVHRQVGGHLVLAGKLDRPLKFGRGEVFRAAPRIEEREPQIYRVGPGFNSGFEAG